MAIKAANQGLPMPWQKFHNHYRALINVDRIVFVNSLLDVYLKLYYTGYKNPHYLFYLKIQIFHTFFINILFNSFFMEQKLYKILEIKAFSRFWVVLIKIKGFSMPLKNIFKFQDFSRFPGRVGTLIKLACQIFFKTDTSQW